MWEKTKDKIIWVALTVSIPPAMGMVRLFWQLHNGATPVGDKYVYFELIAASCILVLLIIFWGIFSVKKLWEQ